MAHEELMRELPKDVERASKTGIFFLRNNCPSLQPTANASSYSVVVLTNVLVSSSGPDGKERADILASRLNKICDEWTDEERQGSA